MRFFRSRQIRFAGLRVGGLTGRRPFGLASLRSDVVVIPAYAGIQKTALSQD